MDIMSNGMPIVIPTITDLTVSAEPVAALIGAVVMVAVAVAVVKGVPSTVTML